MRAEDQFHVGIVTDAPAETVAALSSVLGYEWGPEVGGPVSVTLPTGEAVLDIRCTYSTTVPRLEVIRGIPDTLWAPAAGSGVHHVGYWSDDVPGDIAELQSHDYAVEVVRTVSGAPFFAFLSGPNGFRIELLTRAAEQGMRQCWTTP